MFWEMTKAVVMAYGPSGRERTAGDVIKSFIEKYSDDIYYDALGNLIALRKGTSGKKVMLSAHMDQIGLIVTDIDEKGFLRVAPVGGIGASSCLGRAFRFENGVCAVAFWEQKDVEPGKATIANCFLDIGAKDRAQVEKLVSIGDMAVYAPLWQELGDNVSCAYLDDRIGCAIAAQAFIDAKTPHDLYAVFTVQEEVGCRGAGVAAYAIEPDFNINFDVTGCGDTPKAHPLAIALGKGAAIKVMDRSVIVPVSARRFLQDCADENGIPWQSEVLPYGGTDTSGVQRSRAGVAACCISLACRYVHSAHETVSRADVQGALALTKAALAKAELPVGNG